MTTDSDLVAALFAYTEWELAMRNARRMRDAVEYRRLARQVGNEIRKRIDAGTWGNIGIQPSDGIPSSQ